MSKNKNTLTIKTDKPIPIFGADGTLVNTAILKCEGKVIAVLKGIKIIKDKRTKVRNFKNKEDREC